MSNPPREKANYRHNTSRGLNSIFHSRSSAICFCYFTSVSSFDAARGIILMLVFGSLFLSKLLLVGANRRQNHHREVFSSSSTRMERHIIRRVVVVQQDEHKKSGHAAGGGGGASPSS